MKPAWMLTLALAASSSIAAAQTAPPAQIAPSPAATPSVPTAPVDGVRLPADTRVFVELTEAVASNGRVRGDKFAIRLAAPIVVNGQVVAPAGAVGGGEVVYAEAAGGGGAPGKLVLAARYIDIGSTHIRLKALDMSAGGDSDFRSMQVASEFLGPAVMLINGHNVQYPVGTRARAKVAEDVIIPAGLATAAPAEIQPASSTPTDAAPVAVAPPAVAPASASHASESPK